MITGAMLRDALISAANNIGNYRTQVDELNVFPVPDGDTGTNMSMTIQNAAKAVRFVEDSASVEQVAKIVSSALLRGARGNSGVILSLIFRGFEKGLRGCFEAAGPTIATALKLGAEQAYKAVMKPVEGTILTVIRVAAEEAEKAADEESAEKVWEIACEAAKRALADTPNLLPALKKAKVVDSGGQGLVYIMEGMRSVFSDNVIIEGESVEPQAAAVIRDVIHSEEQIKYGYCTELLISKKPGSFLDSLLLRAYLETIGDSVVVVDDDDIIKVHVHTDDPGSVLTKAKEYGEFENIKIDNMRRQHRNIVWGANQHMDTSGTHDESAEMKDFGFVAVAAGEGLMELFTSLGVDRMVSGGQTMNPSTEDILNEINKTPANTVFVLPNNKNIILTAEQTLSLTSKKVRVIPTKTIPEGIAALLAFDPDADEETNHLNMNKAAEQVQTAQVTFAARDSVVNGQNVKKGQMLGMENGKITVIDDNPVSAAFKTTKRLLKKSTSVITIIYGEGVTEEDAEKLKKLIEAKAPSGAEVVVVNGGQPVYYFIVSVE
ncbi:MAG: DAK2 domain-containing protein [Clostridiales bacterium]|nr:DAK2 domain-containing protein [Clostridiales bacterium]